MLEIISEFKVGKYMILELNGNKPLKAYRKYVIAGKDYEIVPLYDAGQNYIAVESSESFIGKTVEFAYSQPSTTATTPFARILPRNGEYADFTK